MVKKFRSTHSGMGRMSHRPTPVAIPTTGEANATPAARPSEAQPAKKKDIFIS